MIIDETKCEFHNLFRFSSTFRIFGSILCVAVFYENIETYLDNFIRFLLTILHYVHT